MTTVEVKFPHTFHFSDYHEASSVAKVLKQVTGRAIFYKEEGFDSKGYRFVFDVHPLPLADDEDNFSRKKEAFLAP